MRKKSLIINAFILFLLIISGFYFFNSGGKNKLTTNSNTENSGIYSDNNKIKNSLGYHEKIEAKKEKRRQRAAYNDQFQVPNELYTESVQKVSKAPSENDFPDSRATNFWEPLGPFGFNVNTALGYSHTGRCLDYSDINSNGVLVGTSQGGLWKAASTPVCLTDNIIPLSISTFDSDPLNNNKIVIGSGEEWSGTGINSCQGVWVTTNFGNNWEQSTYDIFPNYVYKIRYSGIAGIWYMSASQGFYRSINGGYHWTRMIPMWSTDFDFEAFNVFAAVVFNSTNNGIWKSTNGGQNFTRLTGLDAVAPQNRMQDIRVSIAASSVNRIWINITDDLTVGVFRSTNSGVNWQNTNVFSTLHYGQGRHNNAIGVNPANPDWVIAAGGGIAVTTNNGTSWIPINDATGGYHVDITRIVWKTDGSAVYATSDGGVHRSSNGGLNWTSFGNNLPLVQLYAIDAAVKNNQVWIIGASQDNSIKYVKNATLLGFPGNWFNANLGGDGGDVCIPEENTDFMLASIWGPQDLFYRSSNAGVNWVWEGIVYPSSNQVKLDDDRLGNAWIYRSRNNSSLGYVEYSMNNGVSWQPVGSGGNFSSPVINLSVCKYNGGSVIYITTQIGNSNVWVYDTFSGGSWLNRVTGIPAGIRFSTVAVHPRNNTTAYGLVSALSASEKIYKTTNRGVNWINISGNFSSIAGTGTMIRDLVAHPTNDNLLYAGTNFGCWRTTNAGVNWHRWNNGMPMANDVRDMEFIDSVASNRFYVIAGTYGRGVWTRDANSDDPLTVIHNNSVPVKYELYQNYPNPFNPSTTLKFDLPVSDNVKITVYDLTGKEVITLINNRMDAGTHEIKFNASGLASGVYLYRMETPRMIEVKKMILLK